MKHKFDMIILCEQELMTAKRVFNFENDMPWESKPESRIELDMSSFLDKILTTKQACKYICVLKYYTESTRTNCY